MTIFRCILLLNINFIIIIFLFISDRESVGLIFWFCIFRWYLFIIYMKIDDVISVRNITRWAKLCGAYYFLGLIRGFVSTFLYRVWTFSWNICEVTRDFNTAFFSCNLLLRKITSLLSACILDLEEYTISSVLDVLHFYNFLISWVTSVRIWRFK